MTAEYDVLGELYAKIIMDVFFSGILVTVVALSVS